jgi:[acyl-carrier-protein] S-malonyltransferase
MQTAAEGMRFVLSSAAFTDPHTPVVSNVNSKPLMSSSELAGELTQQITSPVLWVDGVRTMLAQGCTSFVEFGPGRVLTGALKRTERSAEVRNVGTAVEARGEASE